MPPKITSTLSCWTSLAALASATLSMVALSSRQRSIWRPSKPPFALISLITILATLALAIPMNDSGPVWSAITPTLMDDSVMTFSSDVPRPNGSDHVRRMRVGLFPHMGWIPYATVFRSAPGGTRDDRKETRRACRPPCSLPYFFGSSLQWELPRAAAEPQVFGSAVHGVFVREAAS